MDVTELEQTLSSALRRHGATVEPRAASIPDVRDRVRLRRRRRTVRRGIAAAASLALVGVTVAALELGPADTAEYATDGTSAPESTRPSTLLDVDLPWLLPSVLPEGAELVSASLVEEMGVTWELQTASGTPLPQNFWLDVDDGPSTVLSYRAPGEVAFTVHVLAGEGFDPGGGTQFGGWDPASPLAVEPVGALSFAFVSGRCEDVGDGAGPRCVASAVGGDERAVVVIEAFGPEVPDDVVREIAAGLRPVAANEWRAAVGGVLEEFPSERPTAVPRDDSPWPATLPVAFCDTFELWMQVQIEQVGSFGTPGWERTLVQLVATAPPDAVDDYRTVLDEHRAGRDVSATEPASGALFRAVERSRAHCAAD